MEVTACEDMHQSRRAFGERLGESLGDGARPSSEEAIDLVKHSEQDTTTQTNTSRKVSFSGSNEAAKRRRRLV